MFNGCCIKMVVLTFTDNLGNVFQVQKISDTITVPYFPKLDLSAQPFKPENVRNISNLKLRKDDVLLCAYPKSGSHWMFEVLQQLIHGKEREANMGGSFLETSSSDILDKYSSRRILFTHQRFSHLPKHLTVHKPKIVFLNRNPKDVAVSYYNHIYKSDKLDYSGPFGEFLNLFLKGQVPFGSWFDYMTEWEPHINSTDIPIIQLEFEQLKTDFLGEIKRLCRFLELDHKDSALQELALQCSFRKMYNGIGQTSLNTSDTPTFYRKGEVGDWKNWFTVAKNEMFDEIYKKEMADSKLQFLYEI